MCIYATMDSYLTAFGICVPYGLFRLIDHFKMRGKEDLGSLLSCAQCYLPLWDLDVSGALHFSCAYIVSVPLDGRITKY